MFIVKGVLVSCLLFLDYINLLSASSNNQKSYSKICLLIGMETFQGSIGLILRKSHKFGIKEMD